MTNFKRTGSISHLSASSNTTYSTLCSFRFISLMTCMRRPGVPMILGGTEIRVSGYYVD